LNNYFQKLKVLFFNSTVKARSQSAEELREAKITIKLQHTTITPSYRVAIATLHKAWICFTEHPIKRNKNEALLRYAQCERAVIFLNLN